MQVIQGLRRLAHVLDELANRDSRFRLFLAHVQAIAQGAIRQIHQDDEPVVERPERIDAGRLEGARIGEQLPRVAREAQLDADSHRAPILSA